MIGNHFQFIPVTSGRIWDALYASKNHELEEEEQKQEVERRGAERWPRVSETVHETGRASMGTAVAGGIDSPFWFCRRQ